MRPHRTTANHSQSEAGAGTDEEANGGPRKSSPAFDGSLATAAHAILIALGIIAFVYVARSVVLPILLAWFISMMLKPPVRWLQAARVPAPLASAFVVAVVVAGIGLGALRLSQPAVDWLQTAPENVPRLKEKFRHILNPAIRLSEAASSVGTLESNEAAAHKPQQVEVKDHHVPTTVFAWTGTVLTGVGETIALVFLLLAAGDALTQKVISVLPTLGDKKQALQLSHDIQHSLSRYLFTVGLVNVCLGVLVGFGLKMLGMPNPMMWGGLAAIVNFVPYFGPVVGVLIVALAGLLAFDTLGRAVAPAGVYLALHLVEANAVTPFVLGRRFTLNPVIIFVTLIFSMWLWGVLGALLAVPMLVALKVISEHVPALASVADFLSNVEPGKKAAH